MSGIQLQLEPLTVIYLNYLPEETRFYKLLKNPEVACKYIQLQ